MNVGVYVDVENMNRTGGYGMRYEVLREFAARDGSTVLRLNAYVSYDEDRAQADEKYRARLDFYRKLRDFGYKVIEKRVKWYEDESGNRFAKANADLDMAVDLLLQSTNLDRVLLVTGDGDFVRVVEAIQNKGCRVEVMGFRNVSGDLRRACDLYISGFVVPRLLPTNEDDNWGHRRRGYCYYKIKTGGFVRYLDTIADGLWILDSRDARSPYRTAYFRQQDLPYSADLGDLIERRRIIEFDLVPSEDGKDPLATRLEIVD